MAAERRWFGRLGWAVAGVLLLVWAVGPRVSPRSVAGTSEIDEDDGAVARVHLAHVHTVDDLAGVVGAALRRPVLIHAEQIPWTDGMRIDFHLPESDIKTAFRLFNLHSGAEFRQVGWAVFGDHVEIGERSRMEQLCRVRRVYDIAPVADAWARIDANGYGQYARPDAIRRVLDFLEATVETESWRDNGGELADVQLVGGSLVVTAPVRMQCGVEEAVTDMRSAVLRGLVSLGPSAGSSSGGRSTGCFGQ